jgi:CxxC-x17-CxxC domain-containing protein
MTYFNRGGGSDRGGFGGGRGSARPNFRDNRGGGSDRPELFSAVCDECGKTCEVPFRPTGSKPVYCSSCFEARNGGSDRGGDRGGFRNDRGNDRPAFGGFGGNDRGGDRTSVRRFESNGKPIDNTNEKLDKISNKLDQLINLLTPKVEAKAEVVEVKKVKKAKKAEVTEVTE